MVSPAQIVGSPQQAVGMLRQLWDLGSSLIDPDRVKKVIGTIATPIRSVPTDKKDPNFFDRALARITWLHIVGVLGLVGMFFRPAIDKLLGPPEKETLLRKAADWIFNAGTGIGALVLSEISFNNKWHKEGEEKLAELGVLRTITKDDGKIKQCLETGVFPMITEKQQELLFEIRCSPRWNRATCYEGSQGTGKTTAAFLVAYLRVLALKKIDQEKYARAKPLVVDPNELDKAINATNQYIAAMSGALSGRAKEFATPEDPNKVLIDASDAELSKGSAIVNDDAANHLGTISSAQLALIQGFLDKGLGGGLSFTLPITFREALSGNKGEDVTVALVKNILQRVDSLPFPRVIRLERKYLLNERAEELINSVYVAYSRENQAGQWEEYVNRMLLQGGENFGVDSGIGKTVREYFTPEKINELVDRFPMNPRYIQNTIFALSILLNNRRDTNVTRDDLDFMVETILQCDTFRNCIRSLVPQEEVISYDSLFRNFAEKYGKTLDDYCSLSRGASDNVDDVFNITECSLISSQGKEPEVVASKLQEALGCRQEDIIQTQSVRVITSSDLYLGRYIELPDQGVHYRIIFAHDKQTNKVYRGIVLIRKDLNSDRKVYTIKLVDSCDAANFNDWFAETSKTSEGWRFHVPK